MNFALLNELLALSGLNRQRASLAHAQSVFLFGSRAHGVHSETSDYDILCVGKGETRMTKLLDILWVDPDRCHSRQWLGSELAGHVAYYGKCLHGDDTWLSGVFASEEAIHHKRSQITERVETLKPRWERFLPVYHTKYLRLLRRDLQRHDCLARGNPVPPTPVLDELWSVTAEHPNLCDWIHQPSSAIELPDTVVDGIHYLEKTALPTTRP